METIVTKKCKLCQQEKPIFEFYENKTRTGKPYLNSRCKSCCIQLAQLRYDRDVQRENRRKKARHFRDECRKYQRNHPLKFLLASVKSRAKKRGLEFSITVDDLVVPELCPYLSIPLRVRILNGQGKGRVEPNSASVDRIDPSKGYIRGNIQVISHLANRMKSNATQEELLTFARNIIRMYGS